MWQQTASVKTKAGYAELLRCCEQAVANNVESAWNNTCCIDKTGSAEFSEAINALFRWYQKAVVCYDIRCSANVQGRNERDYEGRGQSP